MLLALSWLLRYLTVADLNPGGGTSNETLGGPIRGRAAQMGRFLTKKSLNMGPIFDPQIPKHGSIFRQNHKNFKLVWVSDI